MTNAIIVGEVGDPHVEAVVSSLKRSAVILDAASLSSTEYELRDGVLHVGSNATSAIDPKHLARGWIRRLAPVTWMVDVGVESREAASRAAWLTLLSAILRSDSVDWLSRVDSIARAENKLVVDDAARACAVPMPRTVVTNSAARLAALEVDSVVVKPLGPGHYIEGGIAYNVFAKSVSLAAITDANLKDAPFLVQERLRATRHLRIVTVRNEAWAAALDADGLPLDWRAEPSAHEAFTDWKLDEATRHRALMVTARLGLGFSSQDWVVTQSGTYLLDVNPGGQWLFLPSAVSSSVAQAIASWLDA